jgi:hypothetical protein
MTLEQERWNMMLDEEIREEERREEEIREEEREVQEWLEQEIREEENFCRLAQERLASSSPMHTAEYALLWAMS